MIKTFQDISETETLSKDIPDLDIMQKRRNNIASVKHFRQMNTTFTKHYNEILRDSTKQQNIALSKDKRNSYPVDFRVEMSSLFRNKNQTSFSEDKEIVDLAQPASPRKSARQGVHIPGGLELIKTGSFSRSPSVNRSNDSDKALNVCGRKSPKKSTSLLPGNILLKDEGYERRPKEDDNVGAIKTIRNTSMNNFHQKHKRENESDFMHQNKNTTSPQVYMYEWNEDGENLTSTDSQNQNYEENLWLKELTQGAHMIENPVSNTSCLTGNSNSVKNNHWNMDQSNNSNEKECRQAVDERYVFCKKQTDTVHQGSVNVKNPQSSCMLRPQSTKVAESNLEYTQERNNRSDSSGVSLPEMISSLHNIEEYLIKDTEKNDLNHEVKRQEQSLLDDVKLEYPSSHDYQSTEGIIKQQSEHGDINLRINRRRKCSIDMSYGEKIVSMYGEDDKWNKYFAVLEKKNRRKQWKDNVNVRQLNGQVQRTIKRCESLRGTKKCKKNENVNMEGTSICLKMECMFPEMTNCKDERFDNMEECKGNGSKKGSVKNECEYVGICRSEELHDRSAKWDEGSPRSCTLHRRKTTKTVVRRALQFDRVSEGSNASRKNSQRRKRVFEPSTLCPEKHIPVSNNLNIYQEGVVENEVKPSRLGKKRLLRESILKDEADQNVSDPYEFKATTPYKKVKLVEKKRKSSEICGRRKFKFLKNGADLGEVPEHKKIVNTSSIGELVEQKIKHMKMEPCARLKDHQGVSSRVNNGFDSPGGTAAFDSGPRTKNKKTIHSSQNGSHSQIGNDYDKLIFLDVKKEFGYESKYSNLKSNNSGPRSLQPSSSLSNCHQIIPNPIHTSKPFYHYYTEGSNQAKKNNPIIVAMNPNTATDTCQVKLSKASVPVPDLVLQNEMKMSMDSVKMTNWSRQPHIHTQRQEEESFDEDDILFLV